MPEDDSIRKHSMQKEHYQHVLDKLASPKHSISLLSCSKPDCRQWALVLRHRSKVGQVSSDSEAGSLQPHRASRETCLPCTAPASKWPTRLSSSGTNSWGFFYSSNKQYFFCLWCFIFFSSHSTHFTTLEAALDEMGCPASRRSAAEFSIPQLHPGIPWQSHPHFTPHFPLHDTGAINRKAGMQSQLKKKKINILKVQVKNWSDDVWAKTQQCGRT